MESYNFNFEPYNKKIRIFFVSYYPHDVHLFFIIFNIMEKLIISYIPYKTK